MRRLAILFLCIVALATPARACLWDYDTLRDERRGLPGVAEILAGRFERHSAFFYEDRVRRMNALLAREPANLDAWDNLAVAQAKLGRVDEAIATIKKKDAIAPDQYTTHSNLGTFEMFAGDNAAAIVELNRALAINPNAHFGREKYQVVLAEYLLAAQLDSRVFGRGSFAWPIATDRSVEVVERIPATTPSDADDREDEIDAFAHFYMRNHRHDPPPPAVEAAIAGVVGMIRFGTDESPHLYAALGDLLASRGDFHLAYRAFLRARDTGHPASKWMASRLAACKQMAASDAEYADDVIAAERVSATAWVTSYQQFEDDLIRAGKDPDDESLLAPFYANHGTANEPLGWMGPREVWLKLTQSTPVAIALALFIVAMLILAKRRIARIIARRRAVAGSDRTAVGVVG